VVHAAAMKPRARQKTPESLVMDFQPWRVPDWAAPVKPRQVFADAVLA